jgi:hypothetical protein
VLRRLVPPLITAVAGTTLLLSAFLPFTRTWGETVATWFSVLASVAFILGGGNLLKVHLRKLSDRSAGWGYSVVVLAGFFVTLAVGLFKVGVHPNPMYPDVAYSGETQGVGSPFWWLYEYAFKPLTATMFSMLAFYVASAAFRAFRAKNLEALLLLGTAFIILLGRTFAGVVLTGWIPPDSEFAGLRLENLSVYVMQVFNTAGNRAIIIGIALGIAATSLKIILGIDRSYLGRGD